jgi:two-component system sensor kinase FixL
LEMELDGANLIRVALSDSGTGLSGDKLDKIFEPFYTTKREGLGMGLSICRSIIEAHGGRLWAENNPDRGATFSFTVPVDGGGKEKKN